MRVLRIMMAAPVIGLALAAAPASAAPAVASPFHATLAATEESPPGPAGGTGTAKVTIDAAGGQLCYDLTWNPAVGTPNAAHIHKGAAGTSGPIVVVLSPTTAHTCTKAPGPVLQGIAADPGGYYVNVHTNQYMNGAVRGQLQAG
ncbi:MAG TPA: CHRD domain-containing protein [Candidatus Dormibacteraeota bacterium]|jgi:hypothetical protein